MESPTPATTRQEQEVAYWTKRFRYYRPTPRSWPRHADIRDGYMDLMEDIIEQVPDGPERNQALNRLQESMMWANTGIAVHLGRKGD